MQAIIIAFNQSRSKSLPVVIDQCERFPGFTRDTHGYSLALAFQEFAENFDDVMRIWNTVRDWKGSRMLMNGDILHEHRIYNLMYILTCYAKSMHIGEFGCHQDGREMPGWGCKRLRSVKRYVTIMDRSGHWYNIGKLEGIHTWRIDREKIFSVLSNEIKQQGLEMCPLFSLERVKQAVAGLPEYIDISDPTKWAIDYRIIDDGVTISKEPVGIIRLSGSPFVDITLSTRIPGDRDRGSSPDKTIH